jgi:hypothetical protein
VFPAGYAENQIGVGDLFGINLFTGLPLVTVGTISPGFSDGPLIDLINTGQDDVVLVIRDRITETAVGVLAEMDLFEDISIVEIVDFFCWC